VARIDQHTHCHCRFSRRGGPAGEAAAARDMKRARAGPLQAVPGAPGGSDEMQPRRRHSGRHAPGPPPTRAALAGRGRIAGGCGSFSASTWSSEAARDGRFASQPVGAASQTANRGPSGHRVLALRRSAYKPRPGAGTPVVHKGKRPDPVALRGPA
jgi:hypothetical protein